MRNIMLMKFLRWLSLNPNDSLLLNSSIITYQDKQKLKGRKEDDNPMLVFYQLKEI